MLEVNKVVYKCQHCGREYNEKEDCLNCENRCYKATEKGERKKEIEAAMLKYEKLIEKYCEDYKEPFCSTNRRANGAYDIQNYLKYFMQ
jgi:hypothetical protein